MQDAFGNKIGGKSDASGNQYVRAIASQNNAESFLYEYLISSTAAAAGTTGDVSGYGMPFKNLKFTKSAAVETLTMRLAINGRGVACIKISGLTGETVAITALIDGTNATDAICVRKTDGTFAAASALANGTYFLVLS